VERLQRRRQHLLRLVCSVVQRQLQHCLLLLRRQRLWLEGYSAVWQRPQRLVVFSAAA